MTVQDAVARVIVEHLGADVFGGHTSQVWASLIIGADLNEALTFGASKDALALEELQRELGSVQRLLSSLSYATATSHTRAGQRWFIQNLIRGNREQDLFVAASEIVTELSKLVAELRKRPAFKSQAKRKRNWRAASVAAMCRTVWAAFHWEKEHGAAQRSNPLASKEKTPEELAYLSFLQDYAPRYEKNYTPGPFGRFLEDVFTQLGILGDEQRPFPAASALRSLAQAVKQKSDK